MAESPKLSEKEQKSRVSVLLHAVEDAIKKGDLDEALEKTRKVYEYDIKNMYARAFEERILVMIVERKEKELKTKFEQQHSKLKVEVDKKVQIEINRKLKEYHRQWEEESAAREEKERLEKELEDRARKASIEEQKEEGEKEYTALKFETRDRIEQWERKTKNEVQTAIEIERVRLERELAEKLAMLSAHQHTQTAEHPVQDGIAGESKEQVQAAYSVKMLQTKELMEREVEGKLESARLSLHEEAFEKIHIEYANVQAEMRRQFEQEKNNLLEQERSKTKERLIEAYKSFVILMDASISHDQLETLLVSLRSILGISDDEHAEIIRSVQVNSYIDTLRATWQKGAITSDDSGILAHLCQLYNISEEEHARLTKQVKRQLGLPDEDAKILVIDDNKDLLVFIDFVLKKTYGNIRTVESVKQALEAIPAWTPSLILCDVMMPETGGFAFYDMIQKGEYGNEMKKVPFVFMSGCSDEYMKKIADGLGVDKYLTKPFSIETLKKTVKEMLAQTAG